MSTSNLHVMAAGINPADYKIPRFIGGTVVGLDVAGVVEECGPDVTSFAKGDKVLVSRRLAMVGSPTMRLPMSKKSLASLSPCRGCVLEVWQRPS